MNRKWNEISSRIFRQRDDTVLRFRFKNGHFMTSERDDKTLNNLSDCFKDSKHFIYNRFDFGYLRHFGNDDINNFLSMWGKHIQAVDIGMLDQERDVKTLRKLLSEQVPNLKKLTIRFLDEIACGGSVATTVQLFDGSNKFQLPKLQYLKINDRYRRLPNGVENLLKVCGNLKLLETNFFYDKPEDIILLQSVNCCKKIKICLTEDLITYWVNNSKNIDLKLQSLDLSLGHTLEKQNLRLGATSVISQLLESSKNVIETLGIEPLGLLPGVVFPMFIKLRTLQFRKPFSRIKSTMFPPLFEITDAFPGVNELGKIRWDRADRIVKLKTFHSFFRCLRALDKRLLSSISTTEANVKCCETGNFDSNKKSVFRKQRTNNQNDSEC